MNTESTTMYIYNNEGISGTNNNKYKLLWSGYSSNHGVISIRTLINNRFDAYKSEYENLVNDLSNFRYKSNTIENHMQCSGVPFWWGSLMQEKSLTKSSEIYEVFKYMALRDLCLESGVQAIIFIDPNRNDIKSMPVFCTKNKIKLLINSPNEIRFVDIKQKIIRSIPQAIKALLWLANYLLDRRKCILSMRGIHRNESKITIVSYCIISDEKYNNPHSYFWGDLFDKFNKKPINHVLFYVPSMGFKFSDILKVKEKLNRRSDNNAYILLEDFLSFRVIARAIVAYLKMAFRSCGLSKALLDFDEKRNLKIPLAKLLSASWLSSLRGCCCMYSSIYYQKFNAYLSKINQQKFGLYLMENQGWERLFISLWKKYDHSNISGYVHTSVRNEDLRYFSSKYSAINNSYYYPSIIAVNTDIDKQYFISQGFRRVEVVEAVRYMYLSAFKKRVISTSNIKTVLLLSDGNACNTENFFKVCNVDFGRLNISVILKPHPLLPFSDRMIKDKLYNIKNIIIKHGHLESVLDEADFVVLSSATTAILEVMTLGIPHAIVRNPKMLNVSPFHIDEKDYIGSEEELIRIIKSGRRSYKKYAAFNLDRGFPRWTNLIETNTIE
jgi:surface carbohydrate biosynthesis protein (TIGR04326 family)